MASYEDVRDLFADDALLNKTEVAVIVAADAITQNLATETTERVAWAQRAVTSPREEAKKCLRRILGKNNAQTVANILGASDSSIQTAVDETVDLLAKGMTVPGA